MKGHVTSDIIKNLPWTAKDRKDNRTIRTEGPQRHRKTSKDFEGYHWDSEGPEKQLRTVAKNYMDSEGHRRTIGTAKDFEGP